MRPLLLLAVLLVGCSTGTINVRPRVTAAFPEPWPEESYASTQRIARAPVARAPVQPPEPNRNASALPRGLVAVIPLDVANAGLDAAARMSLEEAVRTITGEFLTPAGYTVLTGETTLAVLADNGVSPEKACEASCALEAAREMNAELFVSGSVSKTEGDYVAFIRLFEIRTGRQLAAVQLEGVTVREIRHGFAVKAEQLFRVVTAR